MMRNCERVARSLLSRSRVRMVHPVVASSKAINHYFYLSFHPHPDPAVIEDRMTLGLGVKFNYNKKYVLDLNYVSYDNDNFDPLFDRDYYSAAVSVTF